MVAGVGTDIIEIGRVRRAIVNRHFVDRVYTKAEQAYCESRGGQKASSYAARFAAKEAVMKAFGTGLRGGSLLDIETLPDDMGMPVLHLSGYFAELAADRGIVKSHMSLSHAREYATAVCVLEMGD